MFIRFFSLFMALALCGSAQQGINNNWLQGYFSWAGIPFGHSRLDFNLGSPVVSYDSLNMDFRYTHANISDSLGNMLFYTNGYYIADATNDTMLNGGGLNPSQYANDFSDGFLIPQGALILPVPGSSQQYYLFHSVDDNYPDLSASFAKKLCFTIIDLSLNNGLGAVTVKNSIVITDSLNLGKITACKHANGRDWWVIVHKLNSNVFYTVLVTPSGILGPYAQSIGSMREWDVGQMKFSPDGTKLAYFHYRFKGLDVFDFDRCNGTLSNAINDSVPLEIGPVGCEFSPNSKILYVCNIKKIYQYDLTTNVVSSRTVVANWDGFEQPSIPNLGIYLCQPQLAPDGKIYFTSGNGSTYMGTIENPDSVGLGCNVAQHSVLLPTYYFNTLPNHPNYFLGCDTTLGCTPCFTAIKENGQLSNTKIKISPNPATAKITLQFNVLAVSGNVDIMDMNGKIVLTDYVSPWSQYKNLNIEKLSAGMYVCKLTRGNHVNMATIVKTEP